MKQRLKHTKVKAGYKLEESCCVDGEHGHGHCYGGCGYGYDRGYDCGHGHGHGCGHGCGYGCGCCGCNYDGYGREYGYVHGGYDHDGRVHDVRVHDEVLRNVYDLPEEDMD